jgi:hypothetical protein
VLIQFIIFSSCPSRFTFGLSTGSDVGYFLTAKHIIAFGVGAGFGLFLAALMACIHASMYLVLGGMTAFIVFNYAGAPLIDEVASPTPVVMGIGLGISAIIGGVVAHFFRKWVVMILSVFFGSYFFVNGIGGLIEHYRFNWIWIFYTRPEFECNDTLCYSFYGTWVALFLFGILIHSIIANCTNKKRDKDVNAEDEEEEEEEREREARKRRRQRQKNRKRRSRKRLYRRDSDYSSEDVSADDGYEMKKLKRKPSDTDMDANSVKDDVENAANTRSSSERRGFCPNVFSMMKTNHADSKPHSKQAASRSPEKVAAKSTNPFDQYDDDSVV